MQKISTYILTLTFLCLTVASGYPHSGRTDRNGGHHDRKNGGYHYHNSGTVRRQTVRPSKASTGRVWVRGYYRKDGTYVRGHYRTAPDGNPYNNYSFPGNYNPNTGKITSGNPQTYLDRYYNKSNTTSGEYNTPGVQDDPPQIHTQPSTSPVGETWGHTEEAIPNYEERVRSIEESVSSIYRQAYGEKSSPSDVQVQYTGTPIGGYNEADTSSGSAAIIGFLVLAFIFYVYLRKQTKV